MLFPKFLCVNPRSVSSQAIFREPLILTLIVCSPIGTARFEFAAR